MSKIVITPVSRSVITSAQKKTIEIVPFNMGAGAIRKSIIEGAGELIIGTAAGEVARLPHPGAAGYALTSTATSWIGSPAAGGVVENSLADGRLTLASGTPVTTTDQAGAETIYYTPYTGNRICLYDSGAWARYEFSELSANLTEGQNGNTVTGSPVITSLSDTSQLIAGMEVTGVGIDAGAVIVSIDSATQVTLNSDALADGSGVAITFKIPANKNFDIFAVLSGGTPALRFGPLWADAVTRADGLVRQNGVYCLAGQRYLGTVRTTAVAGQTEDSTTKRMIWNYYNRVLRGLFVTEATNHNYNGSARLWNNSLVNNQVEFLSGIQEDEISATIYARIAGGVAGNYALCHLYMDGVMVSVPTAGVRNYTDQVIGFGCGRNIQPQIGWHYLNLYEASNNANSVFTTMEMGVIVRS